jgi:hypothetical protein
MVDIFIARFDFSRPFSCLAHHRHCRPRRSRPLTRIKKERKRLCRLDSQKHKTTDQQSGRHGSQAVH